MILYRGTPEPEARPRARNFAGAFFATKAKVAAQYGPFLQRYDTPPQRLLDVDSEEAGRLVYFHTGSMDEQTLAETFMFPDTSWVRVLRAKGYTGTRFGADVFLYDLRGIRAVWGGIVLGPKRRHGARA